MKEFLIQHFELYPQMQIQDAVKLIFQSEFGPGHLIENAQYAKDWLIKELKETKEQKPEVVAVSEKLVRLHLGKMNENHADLILNAMIATANEVKGSMERFHQKLKILKEMNRFPLDEINTYLYQYFSGKSLVVSHTETYRDCYHPHYRVLKKELAEKVMNELHQ